MANSMLFSGDVETAPALLFSGCRGTEESEANTALIYGKCQNRDYDESTLEQLDALLADETYQPNRRRLLPVKEAETMPCFAYDTRLPAECLLDKRGKPQMVVPCLIKWDGFEEILPIPLSRIQSMTEEEFADKIDFRSLKKQKTGIWAFVFGLLSIFPLGILGAIPAIVFGHSALKQLKKGGNMKGGKLPIYGGLGLGYLSVISTLSVIVLAITQA